MSDLFSILSCFGLRPFGPKPYEPSFNERFPQIDDDEFVRRCGAGANRVVALQVRRILSNSLGIDYERIYPEQRFSEDPELLVAHAC